MATWQQNEQKFLDVEGLKTLWNQINLNDYPNNETLVAILDAIDATKADKEYVDNHSFSGNYDDLTNKPCYYGETWTLISDTFSGTTLTVVNGEDKVSNGFKELGRYRFTINGTDIYEYEKTSSGGQFIIGDSSMQTMPFALRQVHNDGTKTLFQIVGPITGVTSCKAEYYGNSIKHLDDAFLSNNIARITDLIGVKTSYGGEIFNDTAHNTAQATYSHAEGENTDALGQASHAEGSGTVAQGNYAHAEGNGSTATGECAHAEGNNTKATGDKSHAEGWDSESGGMISHAEGYSTKASASYAHSEGYQSEATSSAAHAEGHDTEASGQGSHSEGGRTKATNMAAHAEGYESEATGQATHAEGYITKATGEFSHSEGRETEASGEAAHAEGMGSVASGQGAHAEGLGTIAAGSGQHAEGCFNIEDAVNKYIHIVGNGISGSNRSNAYTLDEKGDAWFSGNVYVGSTSGTNRDDGSKKLATEEYVNQQLQKTGSSDNKGSTITLLNCGFATDNLPLYTWFKVSDVVVDANHYDYSNVENATVPLFAFYLINENYIYSDERNSMFIQVNSNNQIVAIGVDENGNAYDVIQCREDGVYFYCTDEIYPISLTLPFSNAFPIFEKPQYDKLGYGYTKGGSATLECSFDGKNSEGMLGNANKVSDKTDYNIGMNMGYAWYSWSDNNEVNILSALEKSAGIYQVVITDENGNTVDCGYICTKESGINPGLYLNSEIVKVEMVEYAGFPVLKTIDIKFLPYTFAEKEVF